MIKLLRLCWSSYNQTNVAYFFLFCFVFFVFFLNFIATFIIYLSIYFWLCWVFGSCEGFLRLRQVGATLHRGAGTALHRGARAPPYRGPSRCGAQAPDAQAQQLWLTGPAAPWHVGSSQTRARTRVPCISRQTLNHCATREAHQCGILMSLHEKLKSMTKSWCSLSTWLVGLFIMIV